MYNTQQYTTMHRPIDCWKWIGAILAKLEIDFKVGAIIEFEVMYGSLHLKKNQILQLNLNA